VTIVIERLSPQPRKKTPRDTKVAARAFVSGVQVAPTT
jgi:hypothetical protein